jgi:hypothetical protein
MTSKKPVTNKIKSNPIKSPITVAKPAGNAPVGKKPVVTQPPKPQVVTEQQPTKRAAVTVTVNVKPSAGQTPPPAPIAPVPAPATPPTQEVSGEGLYNRIQFQAYLLAEKDGFKVDPLHYWTQAERAVKAGIRHPASN